MSLDTKVRSEMKEKMSLTEKIGLYIPIYKGYKEKNLRREEDRAVRGELSRALQGTKSDMGAIALGLVNQPQLMMDMERIRTKVDRYDIDIKKAVNGYSGFHDAIKIDETDLDALVTWDAKILEDIMALRQVTEELLQAIDDGRDARAEMRALERGLDDMMEAYNEREAIMKGFVEEVA